MQNLHGRTNARHMSSYTVVRSKVYRLHRLRRLADVLIKGPSRIYLRRREGEEDANFSLAVRLTLRTSDRITSWSIYREQATGWQEPFTEQYMECVLRRAVWDIKAAMDTLETIKQEQRQGHTLIPDVEMETFYVVSRDYEPVEYNRRTLDSILLSGVSLEPRSGDGTPAWISIEVVRHFNVADISLLWESGVQNPMCETAIFNLAHSIEDTLDRCRAQQTQVAEVDTMEMVYDETSPEVMQLLSPDTE